MRSWIVQWFRSEEDTEPEKEDTESNPAAEKEENQLSDSGDDDDEIAEKAENQESDDKEFADDSDEDNNRRATVYENVPNVTDDEEQSVQEPSVRRYTRTITKP
jgi:hypothetical protein